ncbi:MAG: type IV pilin [Haloarculaceae archaeon]
MRAQSHVVGVALLLGISVVALGSLTVAVGVLVDSGTASADAARVADELDAALKPVETTGPRSGQVHFTGGTLSTVQREVRVLDESGVVDSRRVGGLVFESGDRRVAYVAGAVVRGQPGSAWLAAEPPITASERTAVLVAGIPRLQAGSVAVSGGAATAATLETNVSHTRTALGTDTYSVAVETETHRPFERYFADQNASVRRTDLDGDGIESVVAEYPGEREGYLVVHNLSLEVNGG